MRVSVTGMERESQKMRDGSRSLALMTRCSKPACAEIASVILAYDYAEQTVILDDATGSDISPHHYAMCLRCAEKFKPPRGWSVDDRRVAVPLFASERHERLEHPVSVGDHSTELDERADPMHDPGRQLFFGSSL